MKHIVNYTDRGVPFSAWLYRIAHNLVANWHRDRSRRKVISLEDLSRWQVNEDGPEASALLAEDRAALLGAIRRLPAERQELLALKFVEHLSNAEIGGRYFLRACISNFRTEAEEMDALVEAAVRLGAGLS